MANISEVVGNTTLKNAQALNIGDTLTGALAVKGGFEDYSINVVAPTVLQINFSTNGSPLGDWTFDLGVENSSYAVIGGASLGYALTTTTFDVYLPSSGTYYIYVTNENVFSTNSYSFTTSTNNVLLNHIEPKPSKTIASANTISLGNGYFGQLTSTSDVETYSFNLKNNTDFYFSFKAPDSNLIDSTGTRVSSATYKITFLDSSGNVLESVTTSKVDPSPTLFNHFKSGTYYVQITGVGGYDGDEYNFVANILDPSPSNTVIVGQAINDSIASSSPIKTYAIYLTAGGIYQFSCSGLASSSINALSNEKISLLNLNGIAIESAWTTAQVVQNGTNTTTQYFDPSIQVLAPYSGLYYVSVDSPNNAGGFQITSNQVSISSLVQDEVKKGNGVYPKAYWQSQTGQTLQLTYSFMLTNATNKESGFIAMNAQQQAAVTSALQQISSICNVSFTLTNDPSSANILYGTSAQVNSGGVTYDIKNNQNGYFSQEAVYLNNSSTNPAANSMTQGAYGYEVTLHETGHALGLKHPGNYNAGETITTLDGPFASAGWDDRLYTLMSYVDNPNTNLFHSSVGTLDIVALQSLYGAPQSAQVATFSISGKGSVVTAMPFGAMGSIIDVSKEVFGSSVSMLDGTLSSIGQDTNGNQMHDNINIPWGSQYTNFIGGTGNDVVYCNDLNDQINLGFTGNDFVYAGKGIDTVVFNQPLKNFSITNQNGVLTVLNVTGVYGNETLNQVQRVKFTDVSVAYDLSGNAGQVVKILGAVFGLSAIQNKSYVGIGLSYVDSGMTYSQLSALALNAAGANTPAQIVNDLYTNVVGVAPSALQALQYIQLLQNGTLPGDLAVMAEDSSFNIAHINLTGLSSTGIQYIPIGA